MTFPDPLLTRGFQVEAAHPAQVKLITRARCKNRIHAHLADLSLVS